MKRKLNENGIALHNPSVRGKASTAGITLVSLVVTIIVLIILASVSISLVLGENGIIGRARGAAEATEIASIKEQIQMDIFGKNLLGNITDSELETILTKYGEVQKDNDGNITGIITDKGYEIAIEDIWSGTTVADATPKEEKEIIGDGSYSSIKGVNTPKLAGMTPIIFNETTGATSTPTNENEWYDYIAQTSTTENGGTSHWANAMTDDESMWVWIPRYTYKITSNEHSNTTGTIDIKFSNGTTDYTSDGYKLHPAFNFGGNVTGIWVAKFEMSMETDGTETSVTSTTIGNVVTSSTVKMVSKPERNSWRYIQVSNIFTNSLNYNTSKQSHMMKNTEWGAVAYLAHSKYGRNGTEVTINNNSSFMTGYGGDTVSASSSANTGTANNQWTGTYGKLASTTGNIYGIYDMSGGAYEYVAGYVDNSATQTSLSTYSSSLLSADIKYKDVYAIGASDTYALNYEANSSKYGDAVYETSNSYSGFNSWNADYSYFPYTTNPVFLRGRSLQWYHGFWYVRFLLHCGQFQHHLQFPCCVSPIVILILAT